MRERVNVLMIQDASSWEGERVRFVFNEPVTFSMFDALEIITRTGYGGPITDVFIIRKDTDGEEGKDVS